MQNLIDTHLINFGSTYITSYDLSDLEFKNINLQVSSMATEAPTLMREDST